MATAQKTTEPEQDAKSQPLILLVEEHKVTADIEKNYFLGAGFRILVAHTLSDLKNLISQNMVDLLMIDVGFCNDKGIATLEIARRNSANPEIKVLVTSVVALPEVRTAALNAGADGFLVKPAPRPKILKEIKNLVSQKARDSERIRQSFEIKIALKTGETYSLESLDLSEDGIHLRISDQRLPVGTSVSLELRLPEASDVIELDGVVVRHTAEGIGVKFVAVSRSAKRQIDKFLLAHSMESKATAYYL